MTRSRPLDGLRGIAILLVVAGHAAVQLQPLDPQWRQWLHTFANPNAGVRLFFVLSGYLITHLLLDEYERTGRISLPDFYRRRALRIFPAFYTYLLAIAVIDFWIPMGVTAHTGLAAATFTWNYAIFWVAPTGEDIWPIGHLWTLALEQQFYLLWPVALLAFRPRRALVLACALALWCPFARVACYALFPAQRGQLSMMLHTAVDTLMIGCAAALLLRRPACLALFQRHSGRLAAASAMWLFVASPVMPVLIRGFGVAIGFTLDALAAAAVIAWAHLAPAARTRFLGSGPLPLLGLISYSLYLWQQLFLRPAGPVADGNILTALFLSLIAAVASYYLIERPAVRYGRRTRQSHDIAAVPTPRVG